MREWRYERKFMITALYQSEVEAVIRLHPANFREVFPPRQVNNIYFDSVDRQNYTDAVEGVPNREKFRIRWYGDLFGEIGAPVLEVKIKRSFMGTKLSFPIEPITLSEEGSLETVRTALCSDVIQDEIRHRLEYQQPVLLNHYKRRYFLSADRGLRLTLDTGLGYVGVRQAAANMRHCALDPGTTVIELKFAPEADKDARDATSRFPFRLTKMSKYVHGMDLLYNWHGTS